MNKIPQILKYTGFGLVLAVALGLSWWSLMTLATDYFHLPKEIAWSVSLAFDGAAIFSAAISVEYSKSEDSGLMARLATAAFVTASAYMNYKHAEMMDLNTAGRLFYAAPAIFSGILLELFLRFENRAELRRRGHIAKKLPPLGKMAWLRYSRKSFDTVSKVIDKRLDSVQDTEDMKKTEKTPYDTKDIDLANKDMSITKLVQKMYLDGETDKTVIRQAVSKIKGVNVPLGTVSKSIARIKG